MSETPFMQASEIKGFLAQSGFYTCDTYDNNLYAPIENIPAVYLFLMLDIETFERALVAYVGMSTKLKNRIAGHNILPSVEASGQFVMKWFKPTIEDQLRDCERRYITKFDPPWNIIGRKRGAVSL